MDAPLDAVLLDSTVLVDLTRGDAEAADYVDAARRAGTQLFVSVVSAMELVAGCRNQAEVRQVDSLIADFTLLHLSPADSEKAYDLMVRFSKGHGLAIPDALIAATAETRGLPLATDNERHFSMINNLAVKRPY